MARNTARKNLRCQNFGAILEQEPSVFVKYCIHDDLCDVLTKDVPNDAQIVATKMADRRCA